MFPEEKKEKSAVSRGFPGRGIYRRLMTTVAGRVMGGRLMTAAAARSGKLLDNESSALIVSFITSRMLRDGSFMGREEAGDLYYTLFAMECLQALGRPLPVEKLAGYIGSFKEGARLDFVHLTCLARCLAKLTPLTDLENHGPAVLSRLEEFRLPGGGYRLSMDTPHDSIYASFLALLAYKDCRAKIADPRSLLHCIEGLKAADGAYADSPGLAEGTTTVTAAAALLLAYLGEPAGPSLAQWFRGRISSHGGFLATVHAPVPDLLSTATALFALKILGSPLREEKEGCLTFVEDMWSDNGGFCGTIFDNIADCEYTFYGLLSLGLLAGGNQ